MRLASLCLTVAMCLGGSGALSADEPEKPSAPAPKPTKIKGVRYASITVSDIDDALAFYNKAVSFPVVKRYRGNASDYAPELLSRAKGEVDIAIIRLPNVFVQLIDFDPTVKEAPNERPVIGPGYTHLCYQSPSAQSVYDRFKAAGIKMISRGDEPVDIGGYGVTYAYGRDPDGIMLEMEMVDKPIRPEAMWVRHLANVTPDIDRMAAFYTKVIGYGPRRRIERDNHPRINDIANIDNLKLKATWFWTRNLEIEIWQMVHPATPRRTAPAKLDEIGYNSLAFEVTDLDAEISRLKGLGVQFVGGTQMQAGWKVAYAYDPDGTIISLQQNVSADPSESIDDMLWLDPTKK